MLYLMLYLLKGNTHTLKWGSFFVDTNDDRHTAFQLLASKGDEVVTVRLSSSIEY
jgi:hypothetical protein